MYGKKHKGIGKSKNAASKTAPDATNPNSGYNKKRDLAKGMTGPNAKAPSVKI